MSQHFVVIKTKESYKKLIMKSGSIVKGNIFASLEEQVEETANIDLT